MRVLVACEFSGIVRDSFIHCGHDAISCDLLPSESTLGKHFQCDIFDFLNTFEDKHFDIIIAHPPCTYMSLSGNRWYANTEKRRASIEWTVNLWKLICLKGKRAALENPASVIWKYLPNVFYFQPWQFGHGETKKTGLCLYNLDELKPTHIVSGRENRIWKMPPSENRGKLRSITYPGVGEAMAKQWGESK